VKTPVEFGAKLDLSIDEKSYARIETISFDAYNDPWKEKQLFIKKLCERTLA